MPEYPHGTPSWVQLSTPDPEASAKFYGDLFGWATESAGGREQNRGDWIFTDGGKPVGGLMPTMQAGQPTAWAPTARSTTSTQPLPASRPRAVT